MNIFENHGKNLFKKLTPVNIFDILISIEPTTPLNNADHGGTYYYIEVYLMVEDEQKKILKDPTTYDEQIHILKVRGLIIEDDSYARKFLQQVNYYRLTAYFLPFKNKETDVFFPGTSFNQISRIYEFDCKLRNIIMSVMGPMEIYLRTQFSYYLAHRYGPEGYMYAENFDHHQRSHHAEFIKQFLKQVDKHKDIPFVKHHIEKYDRRFPIWVAIELFTFGMLSKLYTIMEPDDKKNIASTISFCKPIFLKSWLSSVVYLRNRCAHHSRLYFHLLTTTPRFLKESPITCSNRIFDILYIFKYLFFDISKWNDTFITPLEALIDEYSDTIDLSFIGFPKNWESLLKISSTPENTPPNTSPIHHKEAAPVTDK